MRATHYRATRRRQMRHMHPQLRSSERVWCAHVHRQGAWGCLEVGVERMLVKRQVMPPAWPSEKSTAQAAGVSHAGWGVSLTSRGGT